MSDADLPSRTEAPLEGDGEGTPTLRDPQAPAVAAPAPMLVLTDPKALMALEDAGLGFPQVVGPEPMQAIERSLSRHLRRSRDEDPTHTGVGLRYVHRQFDLRWLSATDTHFELIGVVNRMDREVFTPSPDGRAAHGETRLIYRLAYARTQAGMEVASRLPMTINVVYWQRPAAESEPAAGRLEVQRRWQPEPGLDAPELGAWLRSDAGPLSPARLGEPQLEAVEIDVQTERWPSTIRPDMAGHAEYLLQVFRPDQKGDWHPAPLENTPDFARLRRDAAARAELQAWLSDPAQREALEQGTLVTPERFLATAAVSVTPRGLARNANRPWSQLFETAEFSDYAFDGMATLRSPAALLRRLDGLSCQGCHESRSIAGFHLLGAERDPDKRVDALAVFTSPHLEGELERRGAWHASLQAEEALDEARPLSEDERGRGSWGTHCGLGDPGFDDWTCDRGLVCTELADPELGTCLESGPARAGGVCEVGRIKARDDWHKDRIQKRERIECAAGGACNTNAVGFPDGMCAFACGTEGSGCGVIPNLRSFNDCLSAQRPFAACIVETSNPAGMRACDVDRPCRDDYICARSGSDAGVCLPPYFLFQLRVDGHPKP